ncbi:histidine phosphatase family protein [Pontibacter sp. SGAir0037]|nr:histidine phosphatase family protein [Pontibacter sp. SGAir0037]
MYSHSSSNIPDSIYLIRHARPAVSKNGWFNAAAAKQFLSDYDTAAIEDFILQQQVLPLTRVKKVYCSTLVRSQLTAKAIFGSGVPLIIDHNFREFERKIFSLPLLRLPLHLWTLSARMLWFMGLNSTGIENFKQARQRAKSAAAVLAQEAKQEGIAVLVAHGLLNNFIRRELLRKGWKLTRRGGSSFLAVSVLERVM